jgi:hypothetical protein
VGKLKIFLINGPNALIAKRPNKTDGISARISIKHFAYFLIPGGILNLRKIAVLTPIGPAINIDNPDTNNVTTNGNQTPACFLSKL